VYFKHYYIEFHPEVKILEYLANSGSLTIREFFCDNLCHFMQGIVGPPCLN